MTLVMAYVILVTAGIAATAVLVEALLRGRSIAARWVWVAALGLTTVATIFAMVAPKPTTLIEMTVVDAPGIVSPSTAKTPVSVATPDVDVLLNSADMALPVVWGIASVLLLVALGAGQQRYRRERARAKAARVGGHDVLLTEDVGPAVAGVRRPVVFVPRWVLALDEGSQQLLLSHELEHVKERDTWLLLLGAVSVAVTPWNPVVWWMVRRMRLAVEQDCDARVLARHPGIRRYADLLLTAASRHDLTARLLAAHFGEYTSDLVRRIEAMTNMKQLSWRRVGAAALVAAGLLTVACETPRPDPVAPISLEKEVPASPSRSAEFAAQLDRCSPNGGNGCAISWILRSSDGKELRRYDNEIPVAEVPHDAVQNVNVENAKCGASECSLIWITLKPDASLGQPGIERKKAAVVEERVRTTSGQLVELERGARLEFNKVKLDSSAQRLVEERSGVRSSGVLQELTKIPMVVKGSVLERDGERELVGSGTLTLPPKVVLRGRTGPLTDPPNVVLFDAKGSELARVYADDIRKGGKNLFAEINTDDIEAIEVRKGAGCYDLPVPCPAISITIKNGREGAYRKR